MANTRDRMKVLKMIEEGKITAEEGAKLLTVSSGGRHAQISSSSGRGNGAGRWLRIHVTDVTTGQSRASVQIPVGLVDAGVKIGAQFIPDVEGVHVTKVLEAIRSGKTGKIIDMVDEKENEHIEIFVE